MNAGGMEDHELDELLAACESKMHDIARLDVVATRRRRRLMQRVLCAVTAIAAVEHTFQAEASPDVSPALHNVALLLAVAGLL